MLPLWAALGLSWGFWSRFPPQIRLDRRQWNRLTEDTSFIYNYQNVIKNGQMVKGARRPGKSWTVCNCHQSTPSAFRRWDLCRCYLTDWTIRKDFFNFMNYDNFFVLLCRLTTKIYFVLYLVLLLKSIKPLNLCVSCLGLKASSSFSCFSLSLWRRGWRRSQRSSRAQTGPQPPSRTINVGDKVVRRKQVLNLLLKQDRLETE